MMMPQEEIGVFWRKTSLKGNEYFTGEVNLDGIIKDVVLFYIQSENPKSPDMKMLVSHFQKSESKDLLF